MKSKLQIFYILAIIFGSSHLFSEHGAWELVGNEKGVQVYNRMRSDGLREFKAITYVKNVKMATLMAIMDDTENYKNWLGGVVKSYLVKKINQYERISYTMIDAPWPVSDRDNVSYSKFSQSKEDKSVYVHLESRPNILAVNSGIVRVPKSGGYFLFKPLKDKTIMIVYQQYSDPGGSIPDWVKNMAGNKLPIDSLSGLVKMTSLSKYQQASFIEIQEPF